MNIYVFIHMFPLSVGLQNILSNILCCCLEAAAAAPLLQNYLKCVMSHLLRGILTYCNIFLLFHQYPPALKIIKIMLFQRHTHTGFKTVDKYIKTSSSKNNIMCIYLTRVLQLKSHHSFLLLYTSMCLSLPAQYICVFSSFNSPCTLLLVTPNIVMPSKTVMEKRLQATDITKILYTHLTNQPAESSLSWMLYPKRGTTPTKEKG